LDAAIVLAVKADTPKDIRPTTMEMNAVGPSSCPRSGLTTRLGHAIATAVSIMLLAAAPAPAQEWPAGTVRVLLPVPPGGPMDLPSRLLVDRLAAQTNGVFILEHRSGAGGTISAQAVVQAPPDGNTLLFTTSSISAAPAFYPKLGFDPLVALTPISLITEIPIGLSVRANSPVRDLADLIAKAKAAPGKYTFGSSGVGTGNHLAGEFLKKQAGIDLLHVPFRGAAPTMTALLSGDIDLAFSSALESLAQARDGRVRVLGIGSTTRMPELPDTPSIGELVPGYVMTNWYGLFGPRGLPAHVLTRLSAEIAKARDDPTLVQRTQAAGMTMILTPPEALQAKMEAEVPRWKKLVPELGIKTE
jgi:tripartite-type tricarboxylate transporter receptor subunit TctC